MPRKQKQYHYLYKTTNVVNEKYYVGMHSTDNLDDGYIGSGKYLWNSVRKYGRENFKIEILEFFENRKDLVQREKDIVNESFLKDPLCMNLKPGGSGGIMNEEHHLKMREGSSKFAKKQWKNTEFKKMQSKLATERNISRYNSGIDNWYRLDWTGKIHTKETKVKISMSNKNKGLGEENSQYGTCWITKNIENKKINKEDLDIYIKKGWKKGRTISKKLYVTS